MWNPISEDSNRFEYWANFVNEKQISSIAELGVWKGAFARHLLKNCDKISEYYLIDPWKKLDDWNKPFNVQEDFNDVYEIAIKNLDAFKNKYKLLRGKTLDVIDKIPNNSLDFAYIDGDHTLKGITIDLISILPKMKDGSFIGVDDFTHPLQHGTQYELSLVDPFALYFAQVNKFPCAKLGRGQFGIHVDRNKSFSFTNFVDDRGSDPYPDIMTRIREKIKSYIYFK